MDNLFSIIGLRAMWSSIGMAALAAVTPTTNFVLVVLMACAFNLWCGMRADGVINIRCKNFSWRKFKYCMAELGALLFVIEVVAVLLYTMGDIEISRYVCKVIGYVVTYYYVDNGLKNLCKSYPKTKSLWMLYLLVHLDFKRFLKIDKLITNYENHLKKNEDGSYTTDV